MKSHKISGHRRTFNNVPLPIPPLVSESLPDETGFTMPEKIALRNAWTIIAADVESHAKEQFLKFFSDHELLLERFRGPDGKFIMYKLHRHPYNIFSTFNAIIYEGLKGVTPMHNILSRVAFIHSHSTCKRSDIIEMTTEIAAYLKNVLQKKLSPTLDTSIDKLCAVIVAAHDF